MSFELEPNQYVVRIYDEQHTDNYIASALIRTYGDRGFMSSISGLGFYDGLVFHIEAMMKQLKVETLEGYMTPSHARLLRMRLHSADSGDVTVSETVGKCAGRTMPWVVVTCKPK